MIVTDAHKTFIERQLKDLEAYDDQRPAGHVYEFHYHSRRVADNLKVLAEKAEYDENICEALYWAALIHDIGKIRLPVAIWDLENKPSEQQKTERRAHGPLGLQILEDEFGSDYKDDPFLKLTADIMENHHECMDGSGYLGKTGDHLTSEVRMACICDAFDGWSIKRPHFGDRDLSPASVIKRMETEKTGQFDPHFLELFKDLRVHA